MKLSQLTLIKRWLVEHRSQHPIEYHAWDMVLTCWVMGCVSWALPGSLSLLLSPGLYVGWRRRLHQRGALRCDWLEGASLHR